MNFTEALRAMRANGAACVSHPIGGGREVVIRPEDYPVMMVKAVFGLKSRLSGTWQPASLSLNELMANDWKVFDPSVFAIPDKQEDPPAPEPPAELPAALTAAKTAAMVEVLVLDLSDEELYTAADVYADRVAAGRRKQTRLRYVQNEIARRERKRGQTHA